MDRHSSITALCAPVLKSVSDKTPGYMLTSFKPKHVLARARHISCIVIEVPIVDYLILQCCSTVLKTMFQVLEVAFEDRYDVDVDNSGCCSIESIIKKRHAPLYLVSSLGVLWGDAWNSYDMHIFTVNV